MEPKKHKEQIVSIIVVIVFIIVFFSAFIFIKPNEISNTDTASSQETVMNESLNTQDSSVVEKNTLNTGIKKPETQPIVADLKSSETQKPEVVTPTQTEEIITNLSLTKYKEDGTLDFIKYNPLNVLDYIKNNKASLDKPVKIINAVVVGFNQGTENYIEVIDYDDSSSVPKSIEIRVSNDNDYTKITNEINKWDRIIVYGIGSASVKFNINTNSGSYESYEPTIDLDGIYRCDISPETKCINNYQFGVKKIFVKKQI